MLTLKYTIMIHGMDDRNQLERLHDRHKRFSLEVYDHLTAREEEKMLDAQRKLREIEQELETFRKKLMSTRNRSDSKV